MRQLVAAIDQRRVNAAAQTQEWTRLQRDALIKLGDSESAAGRYAAAIEPYRQALALTDEKADPLDWCFAAQRLQTALTDQGHYIEARDSRASSSRSAPPSRARSTPIPSAVSSTWRIF